MVFYFSLIYHFVVTGSAFEEKEISNRFFEGCSQLRQVIHSLKVN